jgi:hypothetical protein
MFTTRYVVDLSRIGSLQAIAVRLSALSLSLESHDDAKQSLVSAMAGGSLHTHDVSTKESGSQFGVARMLVTHSFYEFC